MAPSDDVRILVVCSANQCRSPLAAAALRAHAAERGLPVRVASAGVLAVPGSAATSSTIDAGRRRGLDLADHQSRRVDARLVAGADLVIGLERAHVRELVVLQPSSFPRTFTLRELARRAADVGPRAPDESMAQWLARAQAGRRPTDMLGTSPDDDVADPTVSRSVDHLTMAEELDRLADQVLGLLFPP